MDLPIDSMVIFHSYVNLPKGTFKLTGENYLSYMLHMGLSRPVNGVEKSISVGELLLITEF